MDGITKKRFSNISQTIRGYDFDELDFEYEDRCEDQLNSDVPTNIPHSVPTDPYSYEKATSTKLKEIQQKFIKIEPFDDEYNRSLMHSFEDEGDCEPHLIDSDSESEESPDERVMTSDEDQLLRMDSDQTSDSGEFINEGNENEHNSDISRKLRSIRNEMVAKNAHEPTNFLITFNNYTKERFLKKGHIRKKKWYSYKPYVSPVRLLSSNAVIPYIHEDVGASNNNLIIRIAYDDKRIVNSSVNNGGTNSPFKVPLRRPPSRQVSTKSHDTDSDRRIHIDNMSIMDVSDDAISLIGSEIECQTIVGGDRDDMPITFKEEKSSRSSTNDWESFEGSEPSQTKHIITAPAPQPSLAKVEQWLTTSNNRREVDFNKVPQIYRGLCFYFFFHQNCHNSNCKLGHFINPTKFHYKFNKTSNADLVNGYRFSVAHPFLHSHVHKVFAEEFGRRKLHKELAGVIEDLFELKSGLDLIVDVDFILKQLEASLPFQDAVEFIMIHIGLSKLPSLDAVLINVILARTNLAEHWPTIRKLLIGKTELDVDIASNIISKLIMAFPINKKLWCEVYRTLIKEGNKGLIERGQISKDLLDPLEMVVLKNGNPDSTSILNQPFLNNRPVLTFPSFSNPEYVNELQKFKDTDDRWINQEYARRKTSDTSSLISDDSSITSFRNLDEVSVSNSTCSRAIDPSNRSRFVEIRPPVLRMQPNSVQTSSQTNFDQLFRSVDRQEMQYVPEVKKCKARDTPKPPAQPVFGKLTLKPNYELDGSLHNYYTQNIAMTDKVDIDEADVKELNRIIKSADGKLFLQMLRKYKGPETVQSFITMSLAHLRGLKHQIFSMYSDLLSSIEEEEPNYWGLRHIRVILEVISLNIIVYSSRKNLWQDASLLLQRFTDWDSLVTSMVFSKTRISMMGRYIFLAKVFAFAKMYNFVHEILQCPRLHLLESCEKWPYFYIEKNDIAHRNEVLKEFFNQGYKYSISSISQMYKQVFLKGNVYLYDVKLHFDPMITKIINSNLNIPMKALAIDLDLFSKHMGKSNLRALIICLYRGTEDPESLCKHYDMCVEKDIFPAITGYDDSITIRTNMLDEELEMILKYYFHKMRQAGPRRDLKIEIGLPMHSDAATNIEMLKVNRSVVDLNKSTTRLLENVFEIFEFESPRPMNIKVSLTVLEQWVARNPK